MYTLIKIISFKIFINLKNDISALYVEVRSIHKIPK